MRSLMLVCAGLALVGCIVSANLWRELRGERVLTAQLRVQLSERAPSAPASASAPSPALPPAVSSAAAGQPAGTSSATVAGAGAGGPPAAPVPLPAPLGFSQGELMKDPEYRKARLAQSRLSLPQSYPGLAEELELTPEEADQLFDLLAGNQLEMSELSMPAATINGVAPDPAVVADMNRRRPQLQRQHDESVRLLLGSARHAQFQEYQRTRGARQQVVQLGRTLEAVGLPLSTAQTRPLTAAYVAEQQRLREESQRLYGNTRQAGPEEQARMMEDVYRLHGESNRRIIDAARPHLSVQQLEALQSSLDQQLAMGRASSRVMRQQMQMQAQAPPAGAVVTVISAAPMPAP